MIFDPHFDLINEGIGQYGMIGATIVDPLGNISNIKFFDFAYPSYAVSIVDYLSTYSRDWIRFVYPRFSFFNVSSPLSLGNILTRIIDTDGSFTGIKGTTIVSLDSRFNQLRGNPCNLTQQFIKCPTEILQDLVFYQTWTR